ncbi:MAG: chloride channel protein, partial [Natronospirillum sp.]
GVHLGAAGSSALGQMLQLPNNVIRLMVACGSAAAIGALFNTPIAGVIFAMEVILMEYTIAGFTHVILAAVSGTVITQLIYGDERVFMLSDVRMNSLLEIPYVILMGLIIGVLASVFVRLQQYSLSFSSIDIRKRLMLAGLLTGLFAMFIPEIMGSGYDSLDLAIAGEYSMLFLGLLLISKLILTPIVLGLGIPGGFIGTTLMMGGICGALMGTLGNLALPQYQAEPAFYVLLGMCAMMGAVMQAPLAALMATLEISNNSNLILPAMLIIVVSNLTASEGFRLDSIYQIILRSRGIKTPNNLARLLNRYAVSSIMNTDFVTLDTNSKTWIDTLGKTDKSWALLQYGLADDSEASASKTETRLLPVASVQEMLAKNANLPGPDFYRNIKAQGSVTGSVSMHATLQQALNYMQNNDLEYACVRSPVRFGQERLLGFLGVDDIIRFYRDR